MLYHLLAETEFECEMSLSIPTRNINICCIDSKKLWDSTSNYSILWSYSISNTAKRFQMRFVLKLRFRKLLCYDMIHFFPIRWLCIINEMINFNSFIKKMADGNDCNLYLNFIRWQILNKYTESRNQMNI